MKISVIVPIYKVELFIERCVRSLMGQTICDVEYIFVDDASPDSSVEILLQTLKCYPSKEGQWVIIKHEENKGLPSARNTGLAVAKGDYVFHCDSDDWMEPEMLEQLYDAALKKNAEIVWCDFFISFDQNERYMRARDYDSADALLRRGYLAGDMKYNVWNKLVKRSLYEGVSFPDSHSMGEDMTMVMLAAKADKVAYVPKALYHYVKTNRNAYTQTHNQKHLDDILYNTNRVVSFLDEYAPGKYTDDIEMFKLNVKLPFLISDKKDDYRRWKSWFPEANGYAMANTELPLRTRVLQWAAAHNCWWYVWIYNKLVYKFIYGFVYR